MTISAQDNSQNPRQLSELRALLIDLDGVLWLGARGLPGVPEFFAFLNSRNIRYVLVSNNATRPVDFTVDRMRELGVVVPPAQVLTSAVAAPRYLSRQLPNVKRVFIVGEPALHAALTEAGYDVVPSGADAVVVGLDRRVTYDVLRDACLEIRRGAAFIATNGDRTLPTEQGLVPGAGSILAALVAATDAMPIVIGKPGRPMFELALEIAGTPIETTAMLGDRLDTDIDGAADFGLTTILVLTGVSTRADVERNRVKPDFIVPDLPALTAAWSNAYSR